MLTLLRRSRDELRKVAWPGRRQTVAQTGLVLVMVVALTLAILAIDSAFGDGLLRLLGVD